MASTVIHNVRIFDGQSVLTENGYIHLEDGLIKEVSPQATPLPTATTTVDGTGNTILPGLIDAHVHVHAGEAELAQCIKFGVTTVLDMFNEPQAVQSLKELTSDRMDLADIKSSLHAATVKGGWPIPVVMATTLDKDRAVGMIANWPRLETSEDAENYVQSQIAKGADYIKLMQEDGSSLLGDALPVPSLELQTAIVNAAQRHGLITIGHAMTQSQTMTILEAGADGLAHCFCDERPRTALLDAYRKQDSFIVPTLVVAATLTGEEKENSELFVGHDLANKLLAEDSKACFCGRMMTARSGCSVEYAYEVVRMLKDGGIDIVAGTDTATGLKGTAFGLSLHQELYLLQDRCAFTPLEALRSATGTTARRFKFQDRGRLTAGYMADVLMVKGDPTADLSCTMSIEGVWRGGALLK